MKRKICIAGKNNIAVDVTEVILRNYPEMEVIAIMNLTEKGEDGFQRSFLKYANEKNIKVIELEDFYSLEDVILISLELDRLVKPSLCKTNRLFNIHFSLLPEFKGQFTSAMPILEGKEYSGVTFHCIERSVDTGDIIDQIKFDLSKDETARTLYHKYIKYGTQLVINCLDRVINDKYKTTPQPIEGSTFYSIKCIDYSNLQINLKCTSCQLDRQIRAFRFREYQLPKVYGYDIVATEYTHDKSQKRTGMLVSDNENELVVSTIDYDIMLIKDKFSELMKYAKENNIEAMKAYPYIEKYREDYETTHGWSLLMIAAYNNAYEVVKFLVQHGFDVNQVNYKGTSVLMYAKDGAIMHGGDKRIFSFLLQKGANLKHKDYRGLSLADYTKEYKELFPEIFI